jgi:hypothetical protein
MRTCILLAGLLAAACNVSALTYTGTITGTYTESFNGGGSENSWQTGVSFLAGDTFRWSYSFEADALEGVFSDPNVSVAKTDLPGTYNWDTRAFAALSFIDGSLVSAIFDWQMEFLGGPGVGRFGMRLLEGEDAWRCFFFVPVDIDFSDPVALADIPPPAADPIAAPDGGATAGLLALGSLGLFAVHRHLNASLARPSLRPY